ncbi:hypothetical protein JYK22_05485 [Nonomuraea sp. RK-328]|nr:hypothetical protein [Nonomuraea sp. RK-328]
MLVILAIAALAILACVVLVSLGRGGELTEFPPDVPPLELPEAGRLTAVDFMALQLPVNIVGYHTQSVDETLRRAASAISARDTRIAVLEQRVSELMSSRLYARQELYASPGGGPLTDHEPVGPAELPSLPEDGDPVIAPAAFAPAAVDSAVSSEESRADVSTDGVPADGPAAEAVPAEGVPAEAVSAEAVSVDAVSAEAASSAAEPQQAGESPEKGDPENEAPEKGDPENEAFEKGDPEKDGKDEDGKDEDGKDEDDVKDAGEARPVRAAAGRDGDERA